MSVESIQDKLTKLSTKQSCLQNSLLRKGTVVAENEHLSATC